MGWGWRRRAIVVALLFCALLLVFHRPVLLSLVRQIARHNAAVGNLKMDFRGEVSVFTNLIVRNKPHDFVLEHVDLDLNPRAPGQLRIGNLQLTTAQAWSKIAAQTSYANKNLLLRDLVLNDQERIRSLNVDASKIGSNVLSFKLDGVVGVGTISSSITLSETASSLQTKLHLLAENIAAQALNKYL